MLARCSHPNVRFCIRNFHKSKFSICILPGERTKQNEKKKLKPWRISLAIASSFRALAQCGGSTMQKKHGKYLANNLLFASCSATHSLALVCDCCWIFVWFFFLFGRAYGWFAAACRCFSSRLSFTFCSTHTILICQTTIIIIIDCIVPRST